jgi:hypothetical protein
METRTQVIEAIAATIQTRNEEAARLNGVEFNPATRPAEYRAQQRRVDDLQARHAELVAALDELPEEGDTDPVETARAAAGEMGLDCEVDGDVLVIYERGAGRDYYELVEDGDWHVTRWEFVGSQSYYDPPEHRDIHAGTFDTAQAALDYVTGMVG